MDSSSQTITASNFLTPPRILIPKLVRSRDQWKTKATVRKRLLHKERIHSRDLSLSRQRWKERAVAAEQKLQELQQQLQRTEADLAQARSQLAQLQDDSKKG
jgi:predicted  nucleic acid-binding Zn-ribbon protein